MRTWIYLSLDHFVALKVVKTLAHNNPIRNESNDAAEKDNDVSNGQAVDYPCNVAARIYGPSRTVDITSTAVLVYCVNL